MATTAENTTGFSLEQIRNLEAEGFSRTRDHADSIAVLAEALESVSIAMQQHLAIRSIDSQQAVTVAGRKLAGLLANESGEIDA